jgi:dethiobiotin synthetase
LKPVETGVAEDVNEESDQARLEKSSRWFHVKRGSAPPFHVKRSLFAFPDPVSPHLAARLGGTAIDLEQIRTWVGAQSATVVVVETAGGIFSPLAPSITNLDLTVALEPATALLVAPDRLGVLHDVTATLGLAAARGLHISGVALSAPASPDASTGRNAAELSVLGLPTPLAVFPRAAPSDSTSRSAAAAVLRWFDTQAPNL